MPTPFEILQSVFGYPHFIGPQQAIVERVAGGGDAIVGLSGVRMRYAELELGGGQLLEVIEYVTPLGTPLAQRPCDPGASHLALRVEDVDALRERLSAAGVPVAGRPTTISAPGAWHGARCVYVEDPDGRSVELIQRP